MKISTLKYFVTIAEELSFTKASAKLFVSQPSLSRHIHELEQELGTKLFIRHSHSLSLSPDGEAFLQATIKTLEQFEQLSTMFQPKSHPEPPLEVVRIGFPKNFNRTKLTQKLEICKRHFPHLQIIVSELSPLELNEKWQSGQLDLLINLETYIPESIRVQATFLKNHLKIIMSKKNPLSHKQKLSMADLKNESFVLLERKESPLIVDYVIGQALASGFHFNVKTYVSNLAEGLSQVSLNNQQVSFIYSAMADSSLEEQYQVKFVSLDAPNNHQDLVLASPRVKTPTLETLSQILTE
ncbi:LysR family transcriptional regulator [Limosilactobacillus sp. BG-MG3-A]|uniref:LysR family transcriptional regulator n=1 Tax=Limosilactobacillus agrestis TaxID=2759748 RepID=A0A7W3UH18_9LACO|nr:LysR family transcriptional regulator [Limosilactobacillus agrestis]MBB1095503.1 LysR family transcriptional regulator [Limosilactobacillus agrestis]